MSTQDNLTPVRYYTPLDVYHYTVDNRPIVDLRRNVERTCSSVDAAVAGSSLNTLAAGFITRAVATPNTAIGVLTYPGSMDLTIERAVITQEKDASIADTRDIPVLGLRQDSETFVFTAPVSAGYMTTWIIAARVVPATTNIPRYNPSLPDMAYSTSVGEIEWQLVQGATQSIAPSPVFPSPLSGWIEVLRVVTYYDTAQITPELVQLTGFKIEGQFGGSASTGPAFNLFKYSQTVASVTDTISGITVNCNYGLVFLDGIFQPDVEVLSTTSIRFPENLSIGQIVDVVSTAGGYAEIVQSSSSRFVFTASASNQTAFADADMNFSSDSALVFVNGEILDPSKYFFSVDGHILTLNTGVAIGTLVYVFELRAVGVGRPSIPGGSAGDVLVKTGPGESDYTWGAGSIGVSGGVEGQVLVKTGAGPQDAEWANNVAHGSVRLDYYAAGTTVKLVPEGGGGIIVNGVLRVIPSVGVTCAQFTNPTWLSSAVANGFQNALVWFGLSWSSGTFTLTPYLASTHTFTYTSLGVPTLAEDTTLTIVGAARLISGPNRVLPYKSDVACLVRSFYGAESTTAIRTIDAAPSANPVWAAIGPTIIVEPSGVAWKQSPLSTLSSVVVGPNTLYYQVAGLVLPGETYQVSISGAYEALSSNPSILTSLRLNTSGAKYDSSAVYSPRAMFSSTSSNGLTIQGIGKAPINQLKEILVLPEADVRASGSFRMGYYQTTFKAGV